MSNSGPSSSSAIVKAGLRSIAASIPGLASLGQAWNEYDSYKTGERISELFDDVQEELNSLRDKQQIHEDLINASRDEIPSLIEITVERVRKEFSREKRRLYAQLLSRLVNNGNTVPYDEKASLLHEFDVLTVEDVRVLSLFPRNRGIHVSELDHASLNFSGTPQQKLGSLIVILAKLESRGLIGATSTGRGVDVTSTVGDPETWENAWKNRVLGLLPAGERLRDLLEE